MTFSEDVLKNEEKAMMSLRALYRQYGYTQYKMSKFEEYDLYVRNKSFLASDYIITFNDSSGRLMALKPDVTLSIVKNTKDCASLCKYFYNENVYRLSHLSHEFKERMQAGLECIGDIDVYSMSEVILLAEKSLETIGAKHVLDVSHMGFISGLFDAMALSAEQQSAILRCISEKNAPEIVKLCAQSGIADDYRDRLTKLASLYGSLDDVGDTLRAISMNAKTDEALEELTQVIKAVRTLGGGDSIRLDFSIVNDMNYYNGIIFQGFADGIPTFVLSGGRYDNLMQRFGKTAGAIGFAVYLDLLELLEAPPRAFDVDALLLYDGTADAGQLAGVVKSLADTGVSVRAVKGETENIKYKKLYRLADGRLVESEGNA
jgi:ATP phosphoribosyltransferase regulatory subunit